MILEFAIVLASTLIYNIITGMATILISRGRVQWGALFDATRNVLAVLILSYVALHVRDNYWLLVPLFVGYYIGMTISGFIIDALRLGDVVITAMINGDKHVAREVAESLSALGIMNTSFIGTGSRSKTVAIVVITPRKRLESTIKIIRHLARERGENVKITVSDTVESR